MNIYVITNADGTLATITEWLEQTGDYTIIHCVSGHEAVQALRRAETGAGPEPDLILVDRTESLSAIELCHLIRVHQAYAEIPVVALLDRNESEQIDTLLYLLNLDVLVRPFHTAEFMLRVRSALRYRAEVVKRVQPVDELTEARKTSAPVQRVWNLSQDSVTGLPGMEHFQEALSVEWRRGLREDSALSVVRIVVDNFREYSEHYGTIKANALLREIAQIVKTELRRAGDVVALIAEGQIGAILPETDLLGVTVVCEIVRTAVSNLRIPNAVSLSAPHVTITLGAATVRCSQIGDCPDVIDSAGIALVEAIQDGGNRVKAINLGR
ncbi:MAG: diguanylate cyclase domain-containing protein [Solirubrobacterales bacterium]